MAGVGPYFRSFQCRHSGCLHPIGAMRPSLPLSITRAKVLNRWVILHLLWLAFLLHVPQCDARSRLDQPKQTGLYTIFMSYL